jgi:hypothetical protein
MMRYNGLPRGFYFMVFELNYLMNLKVNTNSLLCTNTMMNYVSMERGDKKEYHFVILRSTDFFKTNYKEIKAHAKSFIKKEIKDGNKK